MNIFIEASKLQEKNKPFAIATITESKGSTPRHSAKMIIKSDGRIIGTIGGGLAEAYIIEEAVEVIKSRKSKSAIYTLNRDKKDGLAMDCGGKMTVFIEYIGSNTKLVIFGGGHVSLAIAKAANFINYHVTIVENRKEFATSDRFPFVENIICEEDFENAIEQLDIDSETYIVMVTGSFDEIILRKIISSEAAYIGMLGSRRKVATIINNLKKDDFPKSKLDALYAPIGLDLGTESCEEIAISIISEIMMIHSGKSGTQMKRKKEGVIVVRGGGDLATGTIYRLHQSGFQVVVLEIEAPTVIRTTVSFAQAVYSGMTTVEGVTARRVASLADIQNAFRNGEIPIVIDKNGGKIPELSPIAVIDAIIAKKNLGTTKDMAPIVIGLGPGFEAGKDVDAVVETQRGHYLGSVIYSGFAAENTNIPGNIGGFTEERLIRSNSHGTVYPLKEIGDHVEKGEIVTKVGNQEVQASISGVIRGMINQGLEVAEGFKIGDIDPRNEKVYCHTISDKARSIAGGVLEAFLRLSNKNQKQL
jgi:xanthine dehydrogenase accessory factor